MCVWTLIGFLVAIALVTIILVIVLLPTSSDESKTTNIVQGNASETPMGDSNGDGVVVVPGNKENNGQEGGEAQVPPGNLVQILNIKVYFDFHTDKEQFESLPDMLSQADYDQLLNWTWAFWDETLSSNFAENIPDATYQQDLLAERVYLANSGTRDRRLNMLGITSIQMTYKGSPDALIDSTLRAVLGESTQAGLSSFIQRKDDEENSATATTRSIWTTVPQFRFSGFDPGDQVKQSPVSYTRVVYTLSVAVPKSTTQSDLYTLNGKLLVNEATTDFLNTYLPWNSNTMEAVETRGEISVPVGTSCLPRSSDDSSSVYLEMATVFQVPLE